MAVKKTKTKDLFSLGVEAVECSPRFRMPKLLPGDEAFERSTCKKVTIKAVTVDVALKDQTNKRDEGITSMISYWIVGSTEKFYEEQLLSKQEMLDYLERQYKERRERILSA